MQRNGKQAAGTDGNSKTVSAKTRILVVEDEMPVAMMIVSLLSHVGCDVQVASSGDKGMELAKEQKFDLITLDVDLPGINGFEICRELKQRHISHRTPIIFVTGRSHEEDRRFGLELGAVDYITKPFEVTDFIFRIVSHAKAKINPATAMISEGAAT